MGVGSGDKTDPKAQRLAEHVAIIMDGNGRWATNRGWPRLVGPCMAASVMAATSALQPTKSAISSTHSMLISVESMSKAISLKSRRARGAAMPRTVRPGLISRASWAGGVEFICF